MPGPRISNKIILRTNGVHAFPESLLVGHGSKFIIAALANQDFAFQKIILWLNPFQSSMKTDNTLKRGTQFCCVYDNESAKTISHGSYF